AFRGCCDRLDIRSFPTRRSSDLSQQRRAMVAAPFGRALPVLKPEPPPPEPYWSPEVIPAWRAWVWGEGELRGVWRVWTTADFERSEEHTSELQSRENLVCRPLRE